MGDLMQMAQTSLDPVREFLRSFYGAQELSQDKEIRERQLANAELEMRLRGFHMQQQQAQADASAMRAYIEERHKEALEAEQRAMKIASAMPGLRAAALQAATLLPGQPERYPQGPTDTGEPLAPIPAQPASAVLPPGFWEQQVGALGIDPNDPRYQFAATPAQVEQEQIRRNVLGNKEYQRPFEAQVGTRRAYIDPGTMQPIPGLGGPMWKDEGGAGGGGLVGTWTVHQDPQTGSLWQYNSKTGEWRPANLPGGAIPMFSKSSGITVVQLGELKDKFRESVMGFANPQTGKPFKDYGELNSYVDTAFPTYLQELQRQAQSLSAGAGRQAAAQGTAGAGAATSPGPSMMAAHGVPADSGIPKAPRQGAKLDRATAEKYFDLAGGDKQLAASLATADGWAL